MAWAPATALLLAGHRPSLAAQPAATPTMAGATRPAPATAPSATVADANPPRGVGRRPLRFPVDFGAHPDTRIEWWYATGQLESQGRPYGFQVTFFRSRTGVAEPHPSRFAATQLIFAHAAVSDLTARRLRHDQRVARAGFGVADAATGDTRVNLRDWHFRREPRVDGPVAASRYRALVVSVDAGFRLDLQLDTTQAVLLQGDAGFSRKGPDEGQASHYYSQPQLAVTGTLALDRRAGPVTGRAWLDHEWSNTLLHPDAVGWDWIGINLDDGSALTAFRLRRADGNAVWAGGSWRAPGAPAQAFGADAVRFEAGRRWRSATSQAIYPVQWTVVTPLGRHTVEAAFDDQELDSRRSTGSVYWEGACRLLDAQGVLVGRGYLEMTGYAAPLQL